MNKIILTMYDKFMEKYLTIICNDDNYGKTLEKFYNEDARFENVQKFITNRLEMHI